MPLFSFSLRTALGESESTASRAASLALNAQNEAERLLRTRRPVQPIDVAKTFADANAELNLLINKIDKEYLAPMEELGRIEGLQKQLNQFQLKLPDQTGG